MLRCCLVAIGVLTTYDSRAVDFDACGLGASPDDDIACREVTAAYQHRVNEIRAEIAERKAPAWAGHYYKDGLTNYREIYLAPIAGFTDKGEIDIGGPSYRYGRVSVEGDGLTLEPEVGPKLDANTFYLVVWGDRKYLLTSDKAMEFANDANRGWEPSCEQAQYFLLHEGDRYALAYGTPALPQPLQERLRFVPIVAAIQTILEIRPKMHSGDVQYHVVISAGSKEGLRIGMELGQPEDEEEKPDTTVGVSLFTWPASEAQWSWMTVSEISDHEAKGWLDVNLPSSGIATAVNLPTAGKHLTTGAGRIPPWNALWCLRELIE